MLKRIFDFVAASFLLVFLLPLILAINILIIWKMGRPVLFKQKRAGLRGKSFYIYKYRTMNDIFDQNGNLLPDSHRLTRIGKTLRRFSLDELPQLFNVLKGELSLVGPRPLLTDYLELYNSEQRRRHDVKPGITGWAQINGRNSLTWEEKFKLDIWYVDNHHFLLDMKIILLTIFAIFSPKGINQEGQATMEKFIGLNKKINQKENDS